MLIMVLGSGGSEGVPINGCDNNNCKTAIMNKLFQRRPSSVLVQTGDGKHILIDAGTDVLEYYTGKIDLMLLTHWHHDHVAGLYRLRWSKFNIPLHAPSESPDSQILKSPKNLKIYLHDEPPVLKLGRTEIIGFKLNHSVQTFGYIIRDGGKSFAVIFDTKCVPNQSKGLIENNDVDFALIDATFAPGVEDNYHNNVDDAIVIGEKYSKKYALTHIAYHNLDFRSLWEYVKKKSGKGMVAYDGMIVQL